MPKVLHILDHSLPLQSGYTFRTRAILLEQRRRGWETFHLTSPKHKGATAREERVEEFVFHRTLWTPTGPERLPLVRELALMRATAKRLEELVEEIRPDVLHAHSPVLNVLPALSVGKRFGVPVVYEVRAFWEDAAVDHGTSRNNGPRYRLTRALETFALNRAGQVTTICEGLKGDMVKRGIPAERITVIPNAVDVSTFEFGVKPDLALKSQLGLSDAVVVSFIGSLYAYEGLDLLLTALPRLLATDPGVRVLLVGGGPAEEALRALAHKMGISDKILFAGRVPHAEVARYYSIADVLVYPRHSMRLTELVTPLKPLEAMAQGRLVVASDVGGHRELIRDGDNGILFRAGDAKSLADALHRILAQSARWPALRAQGRRYVEQERNWPTSVERYREVFGRLAPAAHWS